MGYYLRYIVTDEKEVTLTVLESGLKQHNVAYSIERDNESDDEGNFNFNDDIYGAIEINRPGDGLFDEEIEELKEFLEDAEGERKSEVLQVLDDAKAIVAVQVLWAAREAEETLEIINPLWLWLYANRKGLAQADDEGYYNAEGLVLEVE